MNDFCAQDEIRTRTPLQAPPPQSGASTNFATWALKSAILKFLSKNLRVQI